MKKLILISLFFLLSAILTAQQTSTIYPALLSSNLFLNRVQFNIIGALQNIQTEATNYTPPSGDTHPSTPACHTLRANLAASIGRNPSGYALVFASHLVANSAVTTAGSLTGSGQTLDTPATDGALFSAINAIWSTVAGCVSNP